jgi:hypothetical protein
MGKRKIRDVELMAHWVYDKKFPVGTQFLFRTLMFTTEEDENLKLQVRGPPPRQWAPIYDKALYGSTDPSSTTTSALNDIPSGLNPYAVSYVLASMTLGTYLLALDWDIELHFITSVHRSRLHRMLS